MQGHEEWLKFAFADLKTAKIILNSEDDLVIGNVLYHSQQCAEKALKAFIIYKKHPIIKTHDLTKLIKICGQFDTEFLILLPDAADLNPFATETRYPEAAAFMLMHASYAYHAVKLAEKINDFVLMKIQAFKKI